MLVLTRTEGDKLVIDPGGLNITIVFYRFREGKVSIAIDAPKEIKILRGELLERRNDDQKTAI